MIYMRCPECGKRRIFHVDNQNQIYIDCPKDGIFLRHYNQKPANWTTPKRKQHFWQTKHTKRTPTRRDPMVES